MTSRAVDKSAKQSYVLLTFLYGDPTVVKRYTNWGSNIDPQGSNYVSVPTMEIRLPANTGILAAKDAQITIELNDKTTDFLEPLSRSVRVFGPVHCTIQEVTRGVDLGDSASHSQPFQGRVSQVIKNAKGKGNLVRIDVRNIKARLDDMNLGLQCTSQCQARLFGSGCSVGDGFGGVDPVTGEAARGPQQFLERKTPIIASIDGKIINLTPGSYTPLTGSKSFRFGYAVFNGMNLDVRDHDIGTDPDQLIMRRDPPVEWVGKRIDLFPGCANTIQACRGDWNNEDGFMGYGIGMPNYDPSLENPE